MAVGDYELLKREVIAWQASHHQDPDKQSMKLAEEVGELLGARLKGLPFEKLSDEYGDVLIVLMILGMYHDGIDPVEAALKKIAVVKQRKGKVVNGIFRKVEDEQ